MATDPVCGMMANPKTAYKSKYKSQAYYFCTPGCKATFEKEPEKYVGATAAEDVTTTATE
ncbi:MAG: YHS domain-containing protein [Anaerolineae bacterium]